MTGKPLPPPTKFGPQGTAQGKAPVMVRAAGGVAPPPTKFGPQGTAQGKAPAVVRAAGGMAPPPTKFGPSAIQRMMGKETTQPNPEKLEYPGFKSTMSTTATMILWEVDSGEPLLMRTYESGNGLHAEEKFILDLQGYVNNDFLTPQNNGLGYDYDIFLHVSKSPCSSTSVPATRTDGNLGCKERLDDLIANGLQNTHGQTVRFNFLPSATKPYQPKVKGGKNASRDSYDTFPQKFDFLK
jgi:hypothetical protein